MKIAWHPLNHHGSFIYTSSNTCFCASLLDEIQDWPCPSKLDSRAPVTSQHVEILFCCVPTSQAIGATEMRTVVFSWLFCPMFLSFWKLKQNAIECINIGSIYEHTSQQLRHFCVLRRLKNIAYQMPSSSHCRSGLLRWLDLGQTFSAINIYNNFPLKS